MRCFASITLCLTALLAFTPAVLADVTADPSRLVLNETTRAGQINVHNSGGHTLRIKTLWAAIAQGPNGILHPAEVNPVLPLTHNLQMWPGDFILKPDETRPLYVMLPPKAPVLGEQHVHIRINADRVNGKGPRWGLSLPVFVRETGMPVTAQIIQARKGGPQSVLVNLYRKGGATPYGKLVATTMQGQVLGELGNITLYADQKPIQYEIPLDLMPRAHETILVTYLGSGEFENQVFDVQETH